MILYYTRHGRYCNYISRIIHLADVFSTSHGSYCITHVTDVIEITSHGWYISRMFLAHLTDDILLYTSRTLLYYMSRIIHVTDVFNTSHGSYCIIHLTDVMVITSHGCYISRMFFSTSHGSYFSIRADLFKTRTDVLIRSVSNKVRVLFVSVWCFTTTINVTNTTS